MVTDYLATLYLAVEIGSRGETCRLLHGGMAAEERQQTVALHITGGGVLVGTQPVMSGGLNLSHVSDLILYDVPGTPVRMRQGLGRFDRFGRASQLRVYALVPSNGSNTESAHALAALCQVLSPTREE